MPAKGKGNGKKKGKGHSKKTTSNRAQDPASSRIFPWEIVFNILSRLPVKSLSRFRCVCKPWRKLISKPSFIATHLNHHSSSLNHNTSLLLLTRHSESSDNLFSLFNPRESTVIELDNPFPVAYRDMVVVGSCNGIVCLCFPPWGDLLTLWNPSMKQSTMLQLSDRKPLKGVHSRVSIGLAYDSQEIDFLILSFLSFEPGSTFTPDEVGMFSTKSSTWKQLKNELGFRVSGHSCDVIVKGLPYWNAVIEDKHGLRDVLVYFDVARKTFDKLPMPGIRLGTKRQLVDLKDSLGMLIWDEKDKCNLDVWVMEDEDGWSKKYNVGLPLGFDRIVGCSTNGDIIAENEDGVLLLFDPVTSSVKAELHVDNAKHGKFAFNYSESLVLFRGMMLVEKESDDDKSFREDLLRFGINLTFISTDDPRQLGYEL